MAEENTISRVLKYTNDSVSLIKELIVLSVIILLFVFILRPLSITNIL